MMHALAAAELLDAWERGQDHDPAGRALLVLSAATGAPVAELARTAIPERDRLLFEARRLTFGEELRALVACPECGERLEFTSSVSAIARVLDLGSAWPGREPFDVLHGDNVARVRPPTTEDLLAVRAATSVAEARDQLLERCLESVRQDGEPLSFHQLAQDERTELALLAGEHQSLADVELALSCVACGAEWSSVFDIAAFFWEEVAAFAVRLLPEVHVLARAYGWSEREILEVSPGRRARYLELVEAGI